MCEVHCASGYWSDGWLTLLFMMHFMGEAARQTSLIQEILQRFYWNDHATCFINLFMVQGTRLAAINSYHYKNTQNQPNFCFVTVPCPIPQDFVKEWFSIILLHSTVAVIVLVFSRLVVNVNLSGSVEQPCHMGPVIWLPKLKLAVKLGNYRLDFDSSF